MGRVAVTLILNIAQHTHIANSISGRSRVRTEGTNQGTTEGTQGRIQLGYQQARGKGEGRMKEKGVKEREGRVRYESMMRGNVIKEESRKKDKSGGK